MKNTIIFCTGILFGASTMYLLKNKEKMESRINIFEDEGSESFEVESPVEEETFYEPNLFDGD